MLNKILKT